MVAASSPRHSAVLALLQQVAVPATPWQWVAISFYLLGEALAVVFVLRVLSAGGAPATTLLWVGIILAAPYLGLLLYYLFPRQLQLRRLKRIKQKQERHRGGRRSTSSSTVGLDLMIPATLDPLRALLVGLDIDGVTEGNEVTWLPTGGEFFAAAATAIEQARTFVHFQTYIFRPDATGRHLLTLLTAAARRGVEVRLLFDSLGSFHLKNKDLAELRQAGGKAAAFLPMLWKRRPFTVNLRNHRKFVLVDGEVAFSGGRNVADEYANDRLGDHAWLDAMVAIRGPAVPVLQDVFTEDWFNATDEALTDVRYFPPSPPCGSAVLGVVRSGPDNEQQELWWALFQAVNSARVSLDLSSPYLVPPPVLLLALKVAAARGVRVRIHTNGASAEAIVLHQAQRSYYGEFLAAGIEIYETVTDYNHAKVLVADGRTVMVGSANLDLRSANLNFEAAIVVPDSPSLAAAVIATIDERCSTSRRIRPDDVRGNALRRVLDGACRLLSPIL
jgi:cardiolipin synthase